MSLPVLSIQQAALRWVPCLLQGIVCVVRQTCVVMRQQITGQEARLERSAHAAQQVTGQEARHKIGTGRHLRVEGSAEARRVFLWV